MIKQFHAFLNLEAVHCPQKVWKIDQRICLIVEFREVNNIYFPAQRLRLFSSVFVSTVQTFLLLLFGRKRRSIKVVKNSKHIDINW